MQTFTLNDFLLSVLIITILYSLFVFLHKRGLKNDKRKSEEYKKAVDTKLDMDFDNNFWPDREII